MPATVNSGNTVHKDNYIFMTRQIFMQTIFNLFLW